MNIYLIEGIRGKEVSLVNLLRPYLGNLLFGDSNIIELYLLLNECLPCISNKVETLDLLTFPFCMVYARNCSKRTSTRLGFGCQQIDKLIKYGFLQITFRGEIES
ncbi:hypothetical protein AMTRI_Chr10g227060 [Amborella trichopoda]